MKTRTYNTIVTSKELQVLNDAVKRCPYECTELEPGKYGFMDNENGDVRNYFCDTLGYECSNYEAFDFEYLEEPSSNDTPLVINDFAKYGSFDYPTECNEIDGFKLGEVVYDQCGEIGVILAFTEKNGTARLNSNGCCDVGDLKKCPKEIAEREVKRMDIIRPEKSTVTTFQQKQIVYYGRTDVSQAKTDKIIIHRGKSLQDIIDQTRRLNGHAGRNWYWSFKREKLINKIYTTYISNIQKLGVFSEPDKKFAKEEYTGIIPF